MLSFFSDLVVFVETQYGDSHRMLIGTQLTPFISMGKSVENCAPAAEMNRASCAPVNTWCESPHLLTNMMI